MVYNYFTDISAQLGIPLLLLVVIIIWEVVWKLIAMWKASKNNSIAWFVILAVVNTVGILPILYAFIFSKIGKPVKKQKPKKKFSRR